MYHDSMGICLCLVGVAAVLYYIGAELARVRRALEALAKQRQTDAGPNAD